jgi:hypothetical protein
MQVPGRTKGPLGDLASSTSRTSGCDATDPEPTLAELKSRSAAVSCRTEMCYRFGPKHGRHWQ